MNPLWGIGQVSVDGGTGSGSDTLQVVGTASTTTAFTYDPDTNLFTAVVAGSPNPPTTFAAAHVGVVSLTGGTTADSLLVTRFIPGQATVPSGTLGFAPQVTYQNLGSVTVGEVPVAWTTPRRRSRTTRSASRSWRTTASWPTLR